MPRAKIAQAAESEVQKAILARAPLWGVVLRRQNTGAARNPSGRMVRYGEKGASDLIGFTGQIWGVMAGRTLAVEVKKEGFRPPPRPKPGKPASELRARWERQLARLREVNANGGYGFWADDAEWADKVIGLLRQGYTIEIGEDEHVTLVPPKTGARGEATTTAITLEDC